MRLIVRRVKPTPGSQLALFASYSYHGFITDREGETLELEADHRRHAEIENAIRDLKYGGGLNHLPSGRFAANGAWLAVQVMAHNLARWTARLGLGEQIVTTKTLRRRFFSIAGRLTLASTVRRAASPCIFQSAGPGKTSSVAPWHDCEQFHSQPDGAPSAADPPSGPLNVPANSRQVGQRASLAACCPDHLAQRRHRGPQHPLGVATAPCTQPYLLESGLARSPSPTHQPLCQRQRQSLRWIRAYTKPGGPPHDPAIRRSSRRLPDHQALHQQPPTLERIPVQHDVGHPERSRGPSRPRELSMRPLKSMTRASVLHDNHPDPT